MNYAALEEIISQRQSEFRDQATRQRATAHVRREHPSFRVRTGRALIELGLKLANPGQHRPATPSAVRP